MVDGNQSPSTKQKEEDEAIMYNGNQTPNTNLKDDLKIRNPIGNTDEASTSKQKDVIKEIEEDETDDENDENMEGETDDENGENIDDWVESIEFKLYENKLNSRRQELIMTIPIVPKSHRQGDNETYEPRIISIGPYHRGKPRLQPMEKHKWEYLEAILDRSSRHLLTDCIHGIKAMEAHARSCYSEGIKLKSKDFVEMILLDSCFIIECLLRVRVESTSSDALDHRIWLEPVVRNDLLLLENQLPFFAVEQIYCMITNESPDQFMDLALYFCNLVSPINTKALTSSKSPIPQLQFRHFLHLYHWFLTPSMSYDTYKKHSSVTINPSQKSIWTLPCATTLEETGIRFTRKTMVTPSKLDGTFGDGVMRITPFFIDAFTICQFRNLIAFEKLNPLMEPRFTAFAKFMDYIIDTSKDVALLRKKGIIEHAFGSDEEVAIIFNHLTSGTFDCQPSELTNMYKAVDKYCKSKRKYWLAILKRDHFGSPWTTISLVAAVILLSLTFIQAFFSLYSYVRPPP